MYQKLQKKDSYTPKQEPLITQGKLFNISPEVWKDLPYD
jgi:hypothetical protein